eukprot:CAMPEP_0183294978 /NCGR_PEP_ID=MMETSP0160_2-20130417/3093_1 /TAXON_ID=2839 ORGANISM="Odontella Sinensis, Strain Grunow 1884" /NCGR_SAMPLE_ID=MMETSP0160_2 /ASSEMBLY_ACC=CAM_ASM_000250 /LENGTH=144 /DNA_ID=CAMNT_0025456375 /DNA_START=145 /DNA_END=579 /DNA_ORIENTATION=-
MVSTKIIYTSAVVAVAYLSTRASGFANAPSSFRSKTAPRDSSTRINIFGDALKGAFSNDDALGARQNAGLKNGPNVNENVSINGKKVNAIVGQKVSVVAASARVKIPYSCKNGDCGTCMIKMNGRKVKACQQVIPSGNCKMETL